MKRLNLCIIFLFIVLLFTATSFAVNIGFSVRNLEFGGVELGESASSIIRVESLGPTPLMITLIELSGDDDPNPYIPPLPDFSIENYIYSPLITYPVIYPEIPPEMLPGSYIDVEISFTPYALGLRDSYFYVVSNDRETPIVMLPMQGTGLRSNSVPEPTSILLFGLGFVIVFLRDKFI